MTGRCSNHCTTGTEPRESVPQFSVLLRMRLKDLEEPEENEVGGVC